MSAINYQCKELVFHFNKKHLEDPEVPMWVLKAHGVTFYVNHIDAEIPQSTKETPDNPHTKGSLKFKRCKLVIDEDNNATISKLSVFDRNLPTPKTPKVRILADFGGSLHKALKKDEYQHSKIKEVTGGCGSSFIVCDILDKDEGLLMRLKYGTEFRVLSPNEVYYKEYDKAGDFIYEDADYDELYED